MCFRLTSYCDGLTSILVWWSGSSRGDNLPVVRSWWEHIICPFPSESEQYFCWCFWRFVWTSWSYVIRAYHQLEYIYQQGMQLTLKSNKWSWYSLKGLGFCVKIGMIHNSSSSSLVLPGRSFIHTYSHHRHQLSSWNSSSCWQLRPHWRIFVWVPPRFCVAISSPVWMDGESESSSCCSCQIQVQGLPIGPLPACPCFSDCWVSLLLEF